MSFKVYILSIYIIMILIIRSMNNMGDSIVLFPFKVGTSTQICVFMKPFQGHQTSSYKKQISFFLIVFQY